MYGRVLSIIVTVKKVETDVLLQPILLCGEIKRYHLPGTVPPFRLSVLFRNAVLLGWR